MKAGLCKQVPSLPGGHKVFHIRRLFVKLAPVQIQICKQLLNLELHNALTGKCVFKHIVRRKKRRLKQIKGLIGLKNNQGVKYSYLSPGTVPCCCSPPALTSPVEKVTWLQEQLPRAESCFTLLSKCVWKHISEITPLNFPLSQI